MERLVYAIALILRIAYELTIIVTFGVLAYALLYVLVWLTH